MTTRPDDTCRNCGRPGTGTFCSSCGQRRRSRFTLSSLLRRASQAIFDLERGVEATIIGLSIQPGKLIPRYVAGATVRYTDPVRYAILLAAVVQLGLWWSGGTAEIADGFVSSLEEDAAEEVTLTRVEAARFLGDYFLFFLLGAIPIIAGIGWVVFRSAGYNLAEHLIFASYVYAQQTLIAGLLLAVTALVDAPSDIAAFTIMLALLAYYAWAAVGFFRQGLIADLWRAVLVASLGLIVYFFVFALALGIIQGVRETKEEPPVVAAELGAITEIWTFPR